MKVFKIEGETVILTCEKWELERILTDSICSGLEDEANYRRNGLTSLAEICQERITELKNVRDDLRKAVEVEKEEGSR